MFHHSYSPTFDEGAEECTHKMAKEHNQCLIKSENKTYLETYNCEYIKSPKPERFSRAMVSIRYMYLLVSLCYYPNSSLVVTPRNNFIDPILYYHTLSTIPP